MATGDPLIVGKDNFAESVTYLTRTHAERPGGNVFWVQAQTPSSYGIRIDALSGGAGLLGIGWGSAIGVKGTTESGHAVMGDATYGESITLGIGVGGYAQSGVGVWGECANKDRGFAAIFNGTVRVNGDLEVFGAKAAAVSLADGTVRRLYCVESPESWFEDFGEARLADGKAEIKVDSDFAALVRGPYHVFLTPYGDGAGLYVGRRTSKGFTVREQGGGKSAAAFSYRIVARRKDIKAPRLPKMRPTPEFKRPPRDDSAEKGKAAPRGAKSRRK